MHKCKTRNPIHNDIIPHICKKSNYKTVAFLNFLVYNYKQITEPAFIRNISGSFGIFLYRKVHRKAVLLI